MTFFHDNQNTKTYTRFAVLLIGVGVLMSLDTFLGTPVMYKFWPVLVLVMAVGFYGIFLKRNRREPSFLGMAVYFFCFAVMSLYCNFTSWTRLGNLWPLFLGFCGLSLLAMIPYTVKKYTFLLMGLLLLSVAGFFIVVLSLSWKLWWIIFIGMGLSILIAELKR